MSFGKHVALASAALLSVSSFALAADLGKRPAPAPAPVAYAPPPVFSWTGAYVGLNAGAAFGSPYSSSDQLVGFFSSTPPSATDLTHYASPHSTNFTGGGQIGYNWQATSNFVVGAEADINFKGRSKNTFSGTAPSVPGTTVTSGTSNAYSVLGTQSPVGVNWYGTVRARLGLSADRALFYITGGLAYGGGNKGAQATYYDAVTTTNTTTNAVNAYTYSASKKSRVGWALGAGMNYAVTNNIIVGAEYLYVDLGKKTQTLYPTSTIPTGVVAPTYMTFKSKDKFSVLRGTVAYKF